MKNTYDRSCIENGKKTTQYCMRIEKKKKKILTDRYFELRHTYCCIVNTTITNKKPHSSNKMVSYKMFLLLMLVAAIQKPIVSKTLK